MINRSRKIKKRISLLFVTLSAFFLFGCGPTFEGELSKPASAQAIAAGNIENGRDLFMGYAHFENGGPPCMGCHSVGENGLLGGGAMGPNLTNVSTQRSNVELASILSNNGWTLSPVMRPIYTEHTLTESEQADLIAFLNASVGEPEAKKESLVFGISVAGFAAAVIVLGFLYRNRLRGVRRAVVKKTQAEK
jgi:mono/diheme cytochrome c family protein